MQILPVSKERVKFVHDRIKVLNAMQTEVLNRPAKYVVGNHELQLMVLNNIQAEKLQLSIELEVLVEHFRNL
jgi:hypothetical protein